MAKVWASGDQVTAADLNLMVCPAGSIMLHGGAAAPTGWVLCDGASLLRAGTYADLFTAIGTTFGSADGTHFNVPNLQGKVPVGVSATDHDFDLADSGGEKTHQLTIAELAAHTHDMNFYTDTGGGTGTPYLGSTARDANVRTTASKGSDTAHNNLQPFIALNYIIKY
jgi:microcystin-dependent protein